MIAHRHPTADERLQRLSDRSRGRKDRPVLTRTDSVGGDSRIPDSVRVTDAVETALLTNADIQCCRFRIGMGDGYRAATWVNVAPSGRRLTAAMTASKLDSSSSLVIHCGATFQVTPLYGLLAARLRKSRRYAAIFGARADSLHLRAMLMADAVAQVAKRRRRAGLVASARLTAYAASGAGGLGGRVARGWRSSGGRWRGRGGGWRGGDRVRGGTT